MGKMTQFTEVITNENFPRCTQGHPTRLVKVIPINFSNEYDDDEVQGLLDYIGG